MSETNSVNGHDKDLNKIPSLGAYRFAAEVDQIAATGVRKAQERSRQLGVPNVYSINGILHWEQPDGSLSTTDPGCWDPAEVAAEKEQSQE